jgi:tetratricopeptide (TPR) repeat protein
LWADTLLQNPNSQLAQTNTAALLMAANRPDDAEPHLRKAIDLDPTFHGAYLRLGIILTDKGAFDEALQHLTKTVEIAPKDYRGHFALGRLYFAQKKLELAQKSLEQAHWLESRAPKAILELALVSQDQGRYDKALKLFEKALRLAPDESVLWFSTGVLLSQMQRADDAIKAYETAIRLDPNNASGHYDLGNLFAQQGALAPAIEHYRAALSINPRFEEAAQNLNAAQQELQLKQ